MTTTTMIYYNLLEELLLIVTGVLHLLQLWRLRRVAAGAAAALAPPASLDAAPDLRQTGQLARPEQTRKQQHLQIKSNNSFARFRYTLHVLGMKITEKSEFLSSLLSVSLSLLLYFNSHHANAFIIV